MKAAAILLAGILIVGSVYLTRAALPESEITPDPVRSFVETLPLAELDTVPALAVGGDDQRFWYIIWAVRDAALLQDSILVVFDPVRRQVQSFTLDGEHRATWGTEGEGPAEFKDLRGAVAPDGRIWAWDGGNRRFTVFTSEGELETDFAGRAIPEIVPGAAIRGGQGSCRWFGSQWATAETDLLGGVPLFATVVQCLPKGTNPSPTESVVPAGRWLLNDQGQMVPTQLSMERHRRKLISPNQPMEVPSVRGFDVPPAPGAGRAPRFSLPMIRGNWADPTDVLWTYMAGHTVIYEPDGTPIARLPQMPGRILSVQRNAVLTERRIGDLPLVEVWRFVQPLQNPAVRDEPRP